MSDDIGAAGSGADDTGKMIDRAGEGATAVPEELGIEHVLGYAGAIEGQEGGVGARVVAGPAPRRLPALPLKIVEGYVTAAGAFTSRAGVIQT